MENDLQNSLLENEEVTNENEIKNDEKNSQLVVETETIAETEEVSSQIEGVDVLEKDEVIISDTSMTEKKEETVMASEITNENKLSVVPTNEQTKIVEKNKKNIFDNLKNKKGIIIGCVACLILLLFAAGFYFLIFNNPTRVYKRMIVQSMDKLSSFVVGYKDDKNITINTDAEVNFSFSMIGKDIIDLINKTTMDFNYQFDRSNNKLLLNLGLDYENENVLDGKILIDDNFKKFYVSEEKFYDKYYILEELENYPFYMSFYNMFSEYSSMIDEQVDLEKMLTILTEEFSKIIESDDCYKDDGVFIYEVKITELMERIVDIMDDLSENKEFLDCFKDSTYIKDVLSYAEYNMGDYSLNDSIKILTSLKGTKIEKVVISMLSNELTLVFDDTSVEYSLSVGGKSLLSGYIEAVVKGKKKEIELLFNVPMFVKFQLNLDITDNGKPKIENINPDNVKFIDELTEDELGKILDNFEKSKLYELIVKLNDGLDVTFDNYYSSNFDNGFDSFFDVATDNNFDEDFDFGF